MFTLFTSNGHHDTTWHYLFPHCDTTHTQTISCYLEGINSNYSPASLVLRGRSQVPENKATAKASDLGNPWGKTVVGRLPPEIGRIRGSWQPCTRPSENTTPLSIVGCGQNLTQTKFNLIFSGISMALGIAPEKCYALQHNCARSGYSLTTRGQVEYLGKCMSAVGGDKAINREAACLQWGDCLLDVLLTHLSP